MIQTQIEKRSSGLCCPSCGSYALKCIDSRPALLRGIKTVRRRRACVDCEHRFSTYEFSANIFKEIRTSILDETQLEILELFQKISEKETDYED